MANKILPHLLIRPGTEADLPLVQRICAEVWGGQDYVPSMWVEWSKDAASQLFLLELDGQPAALYCLRTGLTGPDTGWLQGVRVAAAFRKQGLAAAIMKHAIKTCHEQKLWVLRYVTAQDNAPMRRIAHQMGFRQLGSFLSSNYVRTTPVVPSGLAYRLVTTSEFDGAYNLIINSPEYSATEGFYCVNWWWKPLTIECLREHIEQREVYTLIGALKTLAILSKTEDDDYWLSLLVGEYQAAQALLPHLIKKALAYAPPEQQSIMTSLLPQTYVAETILPQNGFAIDSHEPIMYLYELKLV